MKASNRLCLIALCLVGPPAVGAYSYVPEYTFSTVDVPAELGAFASAYGINNAGVVVGNFVTVDGNLDGFLVQKGDFTDVAVPGVTSDSRGALNDVNDRGQAVGGFTDDSGDSHSFVMDRHGEFAVLPDVPGAVLAEATGINNSGDIIGFYFDAGFAPHGFIVRDGVYTTYDYPGSSRTLLTRINDRGQITGIRLDADGHRRGFVLQKDGVTTTIDVPGSRNTRTGGINNQGQIVGYYDDADMVSHGFLFKDGVYTTLDFPGASDTVLLDINDRGVIAGTYDGFTFGLVAKPAR